MTRPTASPLDSLKQRNIAVSLTWYYRTHINFFSGLCQSNKESWICESDLFNDHCPVWEIYAYLLYIKIKKQYSFKSMRINKYLWHNTKSTLKYVELGINVLRMWACQLAAPLCTSCDSKVALVHGMKLHWDWICIAIIFTSTLDWNEEKPDATLLIDVTNIRFLPTILQTSYFCR
jgi:hypothetical protein